MKRNKKKLLLPAAVLLVVGAAAAFGGYKYLTARRVAEWRSQGLAAAQQGDYARAADLLVRYLHRRPDDVEALGAYVKSRESAELPEGRHLSETVNGLRLLLARDPSRLEDRRHLLDLYRRLGRLPEALDA